MSEAHYMIMRSRRLVLRLGPRASRGFKRLDKRLDKASRDFRRLQDGFTRQT